MPTILSGGPPSDLSPTAVRWTREDCDEFENAGLLNYRYELVEGIINRMGQNMIHYVHLQWMIEWIRRNFGWRRIIDQTSIDVAAADNQINKPEPDAAILKQNARKGRVLASSRDIDLVVEVADSTLKYDLGVKAKLYARAEIREYWVIDILGQRVHIHRTPVNGEYEHCTVYTIEDTISPLCNEGAFLVIRDLFSDEETEP